MTITYRKPTRLEKAVDALLDDLVELGFSGTDDDPIDGADTVDTMTTHYQLLRAALAASREKP